jgi:catechol 2,3-dioxygenase-like lactoylglutathione lyase family enzyme
MSTVSVRYIVNSVEEALAFYRDRLGFEVLRGHDLRFRNDIVTGVGSSRIPLEDPSGNPIELFERKRPEAS